MGRKKKGALGWCCSRSYLPKKWVYKFKAQWKRQLVGRRATLLRF
ncbi:hypothetical protein LINPERPRIM_LOCUS30762 [Linum perenne]